MAKSGASSPGRPLTLTAACIRLATGRRLDGYVRCVRGHVSQVGGISLRTVPLGSATAVSRAPTADPRPAMAWSALARLEPGRDAIEHAVQAELEALVPGFRVIRVDACF
jgi:hypothetical protein